MKVRLLVILFSLLILMLSAQTQVEWQTSMGNFKAELREDLVPGIAGNFIDLANSGFYNNLIFHRVIAGFMIQDGCPLGTGYGGPGYTIPDEFHPDLTHDGPGVLAMANSGPNTNGSQYYITVAATTWLDGSYSIFGHIIEGMDVVYAISEVATNDNDKPLEDVEIYSVTVIDISVALLLPLEEVIAVNTGDSVNFNAFAYSLTHTLNLLWYVDDQLIEESESAFEFTHNFNIEGEHIVRVVFDNGQHTIDHAWTINASGPSSNQDNYQLNKLEILSIYPNPFFPATTIGYKTTKNETVDITLYDVKGRKVRVIKSGMIEAGEHELTWNGKDDEGRALPNGIYYCRLSSSSGSVTKKLIILK